VLTRYTATGTVAQSSRKGDIYAFGILCWELFAEEKPYDVDGLNDIVHARMVHSDIRPDVGKLPTSTPIIVRGLIEASWQRDRGRRPSATEWWSGLDFCLNIALSKKFDIFLSHPWVDKPLISHVHHLLSQKGFRVWYDVDEMGWDLRKSMRDGIQTSTVVLVCVNSTYEARPNCMFELRETRRLCADKPVVGLLTERMWGGTWVPGDEIKTLLRTADSMFCDISNGAQPPGPANDPRWADPDIDPPEDLIEALSRSLEPLVKILRDAGCEPSFVR